MPDKKKPAININLLTEDIFSSSLLGKFLLWSLSIGRYVVVFTELIVILSFLSRFKLDRDLTDLNEALARQKAIVLSYGDLETKFRSTQDRLAFVNQHDRLLKPNQILDILNQTTPADIRLDRLQIADAGFTLTAVSLTPQGLSTLFNNLLHHPQVDHLQIGGVNSADQNNSINFSLEVALKPLGTK